MLLGKWDQTGSPKSIAHLHAITEVEEYLVIQVKLKYKPTAQEEEVAR